MTAGFSDNNINSEQLSQIQQETINNKMKNMNLESKKFLNSFMYFI